MNSSLKGALCGVVAAVTYGTNPLFSLPLYDMGVDVESVLFYRFGVATLALAIILAVRRYKVMVPAKMILPLLTAGVVFAMSSQMLYQSFLYMDAGIACSILFVYPIMTALIMTFLFHEHASWLTYGCIALAMLGIGMLYKGEGNTALNTTGMLLVMGSALTYAIYLVGVNRSRVHTVNSTTQTFWVLLGGALLFFAMTGFGTHLHGPINTPTFWTCALGVALVPSICPILFINIALKNIGPTYSAIIGALEPVTALVIGITVFDEQCTPRIILGALMILVAVTLIIARPLIKSHFHLHLHRS